MTYVEARINGSRCSVEVTTVIYSLQKRLKDNQDYTRAVIAERDAVIRDRDWLQEQNQKLTTMHAERTVERDALQKQVQEQALQIISLIGQEFDVEPVGEVVQIDVDEDGQPSAWVDLYDDVELGAKLYTAPKHDSESGLRKTAQMAIEAMQLKGIPPHMQWAYENLRKELGL